MGEETKPPQEETKKEETKDDNVNAAATEEKKEDNAAKEKKEEPEKAEAKPPAPFVLFVDLHCMGCAKKIERSILKIRGVEGVVIDMAKNEVTIKGVVEPKAVCSRIMKKTKRKAKVLSPLLPTAEGETPIPEVVASQVSGLITIELNVNMHCEACAQQLNKKILKMKGVRTVETEFSSSKVKVTGTMDADRLVNYVYRRTKKQAKVVAQPEPEKPSEVSQEAEGKKEEKPAEEEAKPEEQKEAAPAEEEEGKKEGGGEAAAAAGDEVVKVNYDEEHYMMHRMMYHYYQPQLQPPPPVYVMDRIPPAPQLFSDENPNACVVM